MEAKRIEQIIRVHDIVIREQNGQEVIMLRQNINLLSDDEKDEIRTAKPEIIKFIKDKAAAEKEAYENEKTAIMSGEKKIELTLEDYDYPRWILLGKVENELLKAIGIVESVGYDTMLIDKAEKALGHSFTYQQAIEFMKPITDVKQQKEEAEKARIAEIFETAKATGKKQALKSWMEDCNDPREECSTDSVTLWAMPNGTTKTTRQHTW